MNEVKGGKRWRKKKSREVGPGREAGRGPVRQAPPAML